VYTTHGNFGDKDRRRCVRTWDLSLAPQLCKNSDFLLETVDYMKWIIRWNRCAIPTQLFCNVVIASWCVRRGGEGRGGREDRKYTVHTSARCSVEGGDETRRDERASPLLSWTRLGVFLFTSSSTPITLKKVCRLGVGTQTFFINGKQNSNLCTGVKIIELVSLCVCG
jgi:hypothetical protein